MRDIFLLAVFAGLVPAILFRPHVGILVWAWISYMNPHRLTWGIAFDLRLALMCAAVTFAAWVLSREPVKIPLKTTTVLMGLLIVWTFITTQFAVAPEIAQESWEKSTKILVMTLVTLGLIQSRERIHAFVWVIVVSIGFFGIKGALWFVTGGSETGGRVWGPPGTFIEGNNELALALVMVIPLMLYLRTHTAQTWMRHGLALASLLAVVSVMGAFSRGAFLAAAAIAVALVLRSRKKVRLALVIFTAGLGVILYAPERWVERIETIAEYQEDGSAIGRLELWEFAWNLALDRPILGGGNNAFADPATFARHAPPGAPPRAYHSIYFQMLGDHGFVGFGIFALLWLFAFLSIRRVKKMTKERPDLLWAGDLARMTEISLFGFAVGGAFLSLAIFDLFYHLLTIALLLHIIVEREINPAPETGTRTFSNSPTAPARHRWSPNLGTSRWATRRP